jgi:hypothetical protein
MIIPPRSGVNYVPTTSTCPEKSIPGTQSWPCPPEARGETLPDVTSIRQSAVVGEPGRDLQLGDLLELIETCQYILTKYQLAFNSHISAIRYLSASVHLDHVRTHLRAKIYRPRMPLKVFSWSAIDCAQASFTLALLAPLCPTRQIQPSPQLC